MRLTDNADLITGFCINLHNDQPITITLSVVTVTFHLGMQSITAAASSQSVSHSGHKLQDLLTDSNLVKCRQKLHRNGTGWGFERCQLSARLKGGEILSTSFRPQRVARWWESDNAAGTLPTCVTCMPAIWIHYCQYHLHFNPLNAELNPTRHLLALVGARHIVHVSGVRV